MLNCIDCGYETAVPLGIIEHIKAAGHGSLANYLDRYPGAHVITRELESACLSDYFGQPVEGISLSGLTKTERNLIAESLLASQPRRSEIEVTDEAA